VVEAFEREVDEQQYERRIAGLSRAARKRAHTSQAAPWAAAIERLEATDNYLGIMLDQAGLLPSPEEMSAGGAGRVTSIARAVRCL
jgi:hypothetical protein